jgi:hypothetical protein
MPRVQLGLVVPADLLDPARRHQYMADVTRLLDSVRRPPMSRLTYHRRLIPPGAGKRCSSPSASGWCAAVAACCGCAGRCCRSRGKVYSDSARGKRCFLSRPGFGA